MIRPETRCTLHYQDKLPDVVLMKTIYSSFLSRRRQFLIQNSPVRIIAEFRRSKKGKKEKSQPGELEHPRNCIGASFGEDNYSLSNRKLQE
ncbi:hypothetical protein MTP99_015018 [Tenebrio molitor]|nr:hypothetical protein MTP99_015018 [Tenebrio molitor]